MRRILAAALAAMAMTAAAAAPAAADDAALKQIWERGPVCTLDAAFERWERASSEMGNSGDSKVEIRRALEPPARAARAFEASLQRCADALDRQQSSSRDGAVAQRLLVEGLLAMRDGFDVYGISLELVRVITYARSEAEGRRLQGTSRIVLDSFRRMTERGAGGVQRGERLLRRL